MISRISLLASDRSTRRDDGASIRWSDYSASTQR
jgi:hypothetical protein